MKLCSFDDTPMWIAIWQITIRIEIHHSYSKISLRDYVIAPYVLGWKKIFRGLFRSVRDNDDLARHYIVGGFEDFQWDYRCCRRRNEFSMLSPKSSAKQKDFLYKTVFQIAEHVIDMQTNTMTISRSQIKLIPKRKTILFHTNPKFITIFSILPVKESDSRDVDSNFVNQIL